MRIRVRDLDKPVAVAPLGCSVNASPAETQALLGLVAMIEGSPIFNGHLLMPEEQERCYRQIGELRRLVGETRLLLPDDAAAGEILAAMRAACRKYLAEAEAWDKKSGRRFSMPSFGFYQLLGALRESMGLHVWRLAEAYDLEVDGRMAQFFPGTRE